MTSKLHMVICRVPLISLDLKACFQWSVSFITNGYFSLHSNKKKKIIKKIFSVSFQLIHVRSEQKYHKRVEHYFFTIIFFNPAL